MTTTPAAENSWVGDPSRQAGVGKRMLIRVGGVLLAFALVACGGKDKGKGTTPATGGGGGGDAVGMKDGETPADSGAGGDAGDGGGGGTAEDGTVLPDDGSGAGADSGAGTGSEETPKYVPPNLDPDPGEAKQGVAGHLKQARDALRGSSPDPDRAIQEAKAALTIDGTSVDAVVILAHAYYHKRLYDTAETILDMLVKDREKAKKHAGVYYVYGLVYDRTNEPQKAELAYKTAVQLKPDYGSALVNHGVYQLKNKQYDEAISTYEKLTAELGYNDARTWNALGAAYRGRSGDYDPGSGPRADWLLKAESAFKRALQADRNYGPAYYNLGLLYLDADPFPSPDGGSMDNLLRLQKAKTYFEEYKNMPGVDMKAFDARMKDVTKLIKREEKKRKKKESS